MKALFKFFPLAAFLFFLISCDPDTSRKNSSSSLESRSGKELHSEVEKGEAAQAISMSDRKKKTASHPKKFLRHDPVETISVQDPNPDRNAITALFEQLKKAPQVFYINPRKDTVVMCAEGTRLTIPSYSFVHTNGTAVIDVVAIHVSEYLSKEDFILANLSTSSDGKMLETGGMLNIKAVSKEKEVKLKSDGSLKIEIPAETWMPDMQLFYGDHEEDGTINWKVENKSSKKERWDGRQAKKPSNRFVSVSKAITYLDTTGKIFEEKKKIHEWADSAKKTGNVDSVEFTFTINKKGEVKDGKIFINNDLIKSGKLTYNYNVYYINRTTRIKSTRKLNFNQTYFVLAPGSGKREQYRIGRDELKKVKKKIKETQGSVTVRVKHLYCNSDTLLSYNYQRYVDSINRFKSYFNSYNASDTVVANAARSSYYAFEAQQLDWINVDRFYKTKQPMVAFAVETEKDIYADVKLVFNRINSIMPGHNSSGRTEFTSMPEGEQVTIVAMKVKEGTTFLAIKNTTIQEGLVEGLDFQPVTNEELKARIKAIH